MQKNSSLYFGGAATLLAFAMTLAAGQTRSWQESDYADFEKGTLKKLSLRSDGLITLAPQFHELFDSSSAYLWTVARDSAGNLYTGGGPGAKLYRISPSGEKKTLAEFEALQVQAIVIGKNDQIYAATSPDGKVYKVQPSGKFDIFYDPKTKYIWALAFDAKGNLYVATGDQGEIHRVTPDGQGSVFYRSEESHARSLAVEANGSLIVGTEPGGLVIRVSPAGEGFVLFQMPKREVTAVAVAADGSIYAAAVGTKPPVSATPTPTAPSSPPPAATGGVAIVVQHSPPSPPASVSSAGAVSGGSDIYRIHPDGRPEKRWTHAQDIVYALGLDAKGRVLAGTGNRGNIYRLDKNNLYTVLLNASPTQITAFCSAADGKIYAATGNNGKLYEIGSRMESEGSIESDPFDATLFSTWGRLTFTAELNGGHVSVSTRSGNLDRPARNWSPWSGAIVSADGARVTSPPARFLQWRATLTAGGAGQSPELESVETAYLPKNVAPKVEAIEFTPANYKFPAPSILSLSTLTLSLPAMGSSSHPSLPSSDSSSTPGMTFAKGFVGARWSASDENGDPLSYTLYIRGAKETEWKPLKDKLREKYYSWDSTAFPDGEYRIRVKASDLPGNPPEQALTAELTSEVLLIDNTPPRISGLAATRSGTTVSVRWHAADALSIITKAEYSLDGGDWTVVGPITQLSDSRELDYALTVDHVTAGEHTIAVRVEDEYDNQSADKSVVR